MTEQPHTWQPTERHEVLPRWPHDPRCLGGRCKDDKAPFEVTIGDDQHHLHLTFLLPGPCSVIEPCVILRLTKGTQFIVDKLSLDQLAHVHRVIGDFAIEVGKRYDVIAVELDKPDAA